MEEQKKLTYRPGTIVEGVYRAYSEYFGFVLTDEEHEDIYVSSKDAGSAVNGDTVEVETMVSKTGRHSTEGRIINVLERANKTVVGTYEMTKDGGDVLPLDEKINMLVEIPLGGKKWELSPELVW